ncbi:MAG: zf-HC2 domain-containing protein [Gemmatimonadaceae bacterium]
MQHLEEGTVHAWLDGALAPDEGDEIERHIASCASCAEMVAEARGFIAASSRILSALDDVPAQVIPSAETQVANSADRLSALRDRGRRSQATRRAWWRHPGVAAAAAATFLAVGTWSVVSRGGMESGQGAFADNASGAPAASTVVPKAEPAPDSEGNNAPAREPSLQTESRKRVAVGDRRLTSAEQDAPASPVPVKPKEEDRRQVAATAQSSATSNLATASTAQARDSVARSRAADVSAAPPAMPVVAGRAAKSAVDRVPAAASVGGAAAERATAVAVREDFAATGATGLTGCYAIHFVAVGGGPMTIAAIRMPTHVALDSTRVGGGSERAARDMSPPDERVPGEYRWRPTGGQTFEFTVVRDGSTMTFPARLGADDAPATQGPARPMPAGSPVRLQATREPCR